MPGVPALIALAAHALRRSLLASFGEQGIDHVRLAPGIAFFAAFVFDGLTGSFEDARHLWLLLGLIAAADPIYRDQPRVSDDAGTAWPRANFSA